MYLSDLLPSRLFMEANETMLRQAQKVLGDLKGRELDQLQAQQRAQKKKNQNNSSCDQSWTSTGAIPISSEAPVRPESVKFTNWSSSESYHAKQRYSNNITKYGEAHGLCYENVTVGDTAQIIPITLIKIEATVRETGKIRGL